MATELKRRRLATILIVVVDAGMAAWGAMAALLPKYLLGPGGKPILAAEYESFTRHSWAELPNSVPLAREFMMVVFRVYGAYCLTFGLMSIAIALTAFRRGERWAWWTLLIGNTIAIGSAMRYDWVMNAIGPFELTEYLGLALVFAACAITAPFSRVPAELPLNRATT